MTDSDKQEHEAAELVRPYVITGGRSLPGESQFSLITLVTAVADQQQRPARLSPEEQNLLRMCVGGYLSVAEISGHLRLPVGVVKILLAALSEAGYLVTRSPETRAPVANLKILEEVLNGLQSKFG